MGIKFALLGILLSLSHAAYADNLLLGKPGNANVPATIDANMQVNNQMNNQVVAQPTQPSQPDTFTPLPPLMDQVIGGSTQGAMTWQSFCQTLPTYQPAPDVNYQGNVDVRGNAVAPADLANQARLNMPKQYRIFLTTDQISKLGIAIPGSPIKADTYIGQAVVSMDGNMTFNGQEVNTQQVYTVCNRLPIQ